MVERLGDKAAGWIEDRVDKAITEALSGGTAYTQITALPQEPFTVEKLRKSMRDLYRTINRVNEDVRVVCGISEEALGLPSDRKTATEISLRQHEAMRGFYTSIIWSVHVVDTSVTLEDWSEVRSPSRARRRQRQGHRQNIRYYHPPSRSAMKVGDVFYMHPAMKPEFDRLALASIRRLPGERDGD